MTLDNSKSINNKTAVNLLRSWCVACGIPATKSNHPAADLTIVGKDGNTYDVQVTAENDYRHAPYVLSVSAKALTSTRRTMKGKNQDALSVALDAFHTITMFLGYGQPLPFERGPEPTKKAHYKDEEFLVALRASEFRRAPNPPADRWVKYSYILNNVSKYAFSLFNDLFVRHGIDQDDLMQYARGWMVNFCARYEIETTRDENQKILTLYLQQRFSELSQILQKKERSILPDMDTVGVCTEDYQDELDEDYQARNQMLDLSSQKKRRKSASKLLSDQLSKLSPDALVNTLQDVIDNQQMPGDVRREAARQLAKYLPNPGLHKDK